MALLRRQAAWLFLAALLNGAASYGVSISRAHRTLPRSRVVPAAARNGIYMLKGDGKGGGGGKGDKDSDGGGSMLLDKVKEKAKEAQQEKQKNEEPDDNDWRLILHNDEYHTFE